jgi:hypothetical protein
VVLDITSGNNTNSVSPTNFFAVPGYDLCTGWGTPNGTNLINLLNPSPDTLHILPRSGFTEIGPVTGPFTPSSESLLLTNVGASPLTWSVINTSQWMNVSSSGGTLGSGGLTSTVASVNSAAYALPAGIYEASLLFTNMNTGISQARQFTLQIGQNLVQNGGFETGDFSDWTGSGNWETIGYNYENVYYDDYVAVHSENYGAVVAPPHSLGYISQTLPTVVGQPYLLSLWFNNTNGGAPNEFLVSWAGNTLFDQTNIGKTAWINLQYTVMATSNSTVLTIGFRNDAGTYMGLDDISVTPVPTPIFQLPRRTNSVVTFTWNTLVGLEYQLQYKTNLTSGSWINLGSTNAAISNVMSATDSITNSQRFYRIILTP